MIGETSDDVVVRESVIDIESLEASGGNHGHWDADFKAKIAGSGMITVSDDGGKEEVADTDATIENAIRGMNIEQLVSEKSNGHRGADIGSGVGVEIFVDAINEGATKITSIMISVDQGFEAIEERLTTRMLDEFGKIFGAYPGGFESFKGEWGSREIGKIMISEIDEASDDMKRLLLAFPDV